MDPLTKELVKYILEVDESPEFVCSKCGWKGYDNNHICQELDEESDPDPNVNNDNIPGWDFKRYMKSFIEYCVEQGMNIRPLPRLNIIGDDFDNASKILGMTGYYDPAAKTVTLFTAERHPKDVLRTFAHELVHHEQNIENRLHSTPGTDTTKDPKLSAVEDEAYLKGNRIFRHWEDQLKEKNKKHGI